MSCAPDRQPSVDGFRASTSRTAERRASRPRCAVCLGSTLQASQVLKHGLRAAVGDQERHRFDPRWPLLLRSSNRRLPRCAAAKLTRGMLFCSVSSDARACAFSKIDAIRLVVYQHLQCTHGKRCQKVIILNSETAKLPDPTPDANSRADEGSVHPLRTTSAQQHAGLGPTLIADPDAPPDCTKVARPAAIGTKGFVRHELQRHDDKGVSASVAKALTSCPTIVGDSEVPKQFGPMPTRRVAESDGEP